ncbi:NLRC3, partial [Symbiodinium microadriaticum]
MQTSVFFGYLYELLRQERLLPRRQLKRLVSCLSLYDAAYFSEIWVFYDYVSLFQYERQTDAEYESFRRSMNHMHMCYAHECNWTVRLEALTPDDVWDAALQNSEHLVMVYDDIDAPDSEVNSESDSEVNSESDSEVNSKSQLKGKVPMAPEVFQEDMKKAAFTHRNDAAEVQKLQQDIYYEKVSACEEAVLTNLPEGELGRLAKALKDYRKLKVLRLRNIEVGEAEAEEFCKALGLNDTITKLEIQVAQSHRNRCSALWKALANALKSNCSVTHIDLSDCLAGNWIRDQGAKALADALKSNCTVTHVNLEHNEIRDEGAK